MMCKDCGRIDGLKILIQEKEIVCELCLARRNGCQHQRARIYKDFVDGGHYSICKQCGYRQELEQ